MNNLLAISFSEFIEYWNIFSSDISVGTIFLWAFLGGVLGFVLTLVCEIVWRKKIIVRRRYKFLQYFTYLYFVFFPLFAGFCFAQWFGFHAVEKQVVKNIPTILGEANILFNEHARESLESLLGEEVLVMSANQAMEEGMNVVGDMIFAIAIDSDSLALREKGIAAVAGTVVKSNLAKGQVKNKGSEVVGGALLLEKSHAEEIMNTEIGSILDTGLMNVVVEKKVNGIFGGLKMQALLIFLLGMAIPIGEIILAHYLERKRLREIDL